MSMTAALRDALKALPALTEVAGGRVYRDERPQEDPLPAVVLLLVSDPRPWTFSGPQSLRRARVQIDCLAASRGQADAIAETIIAGIDGRALAKQPPFESAQINNVRNDSARVGSATTFRTIIDAMIWHHSA
jgi:hypothetical protein